MRSRQRGGQARAREIERRIGEQPLEARQRGAPDGLRDRLLGAAGGECIAQQADELLVVAEEHVHLGREVAEERARRDVGGRRDVLDRRVLEAVLLEQPPGRGHDPAPSVGLLARAQRDGRFHAQRVSHPGAVCHMALTASL